MLSWSLVMLVLAAVLFLLAGILPEPWFAPYRLRAVAFGLLAWVLATMGLHR